jgi:hypothetical protein
MKGKGTDKCLNIHNIHEKKSIAANTNGYPNIGGIVPTQAVGPASRSKRVTYLSAKQNVYRNNKRKEKKRRETRREEDRKITENKEIQATQSL